MQAERICQISEARAAAIRSLDELQVEIGRADRRRLRAVLECDRHEAWRGQGAPDHAEFLAGRYGISKWKARRWIGTAYALEHLPLVAHALESGTLCLDKVVELTRFATPATEKKLVSWARRVTSGGIRARADAEIRTSLDEVQKEDSSRSLSWWWHGDGNGLEIEARLPSAEGSAFIAAIDRMAATLPSDPAAEGAAEMASEYTIYQRRADALISMCSAQIASDADPDRATVVVHAPLAALTSDDANASIAGGPAIHPRTAQRLACDGRLEVALYGDDGRVVGVGRATREIPPWLRRQVLIRDGYACTFPGCETKRFLRTHHVQFWGRGGETNLDNLISVCHSHHKRVHEDNWSVALTSSGEPVWFYPSGRRFEPGPAPPRGSVPDEPELSKETERDRSPWPAFWHMLVDEEYELSKDEGTRRFLRFAALTYRRSQMKAASV